MSLFTRARDHLHALCVEIPQRNVGSAGNRQATDYFEWQMRACGFATEAQTFDCLDWRNHGAALSAGDVEFPVLASPYARGCAIEQARLVCASTVTELAAIEARQAILVLHGELAQEPLMPKNFPFYNPAEHQQIIGLLEAKQPDAIIALTGRSPEMAGALYPFPLIEDGDFDIPSVYMTDVEGERLLAQADARASLFIEAERIPATGANIVARKGADFARRVVCCAHIDAKLGTPGALDNAAGVVVLLLLAESLAGYDGAPGVELVAINGEDYYSNPGEQEYLRRNAGAFDSIWLGVNIDGVGYDKGKIAYSLYGGDPTLTECIHSAFAPYSDLVSGEPWYQGDHGLFLLHARPAVAITSEYAQEMLAEVIHTEHDRAERVLTPRLVHTANALHDLIDHLGRLTAWEF